MTIQRMSSSPAANALVMLGNAMLTAASSGVISVPSQCALAPLVDVIVDPGSAAHDVVEQDRLQAVECLGEPGVGRLGGFERLPGGLQGGTLAIGQQAKQLARGRALALGLIERPVR